MKKIVMISIIIAIVMNSIAVCAETFTIALLDLSGSVLNDYAGTDNKESPFSRNMAELKNEIDKLGKNDTFIVIGFGRKSSVTLLKATMPRQSGVGKQNLILTRKAAFKKFEENMASRGKSIDGTKTDVVGSLFRVSRFIEEANFTEGTQKRIIIFSDMIDNENLGMSLKRISKNNKNVIESIKSRNLDYPNLKSVDVSIYSAFSDVKNLSTVDTEMAIKNLKAFWMGYFSKCGSAVKLYKTNY